MGSWYLIVKIFAEKWCLRANHVGRYSGLIYGDPSAASGSQVASGKIR
jgi:hypothetical protein